MISDYFRFGLHFIAWTKIGTIFKVVVEVSGGGGGLGLKLGSGTTKPFSQGTAAAMTA